MTAEIAVMNRNGIGLAADSAITSGEKIFNTANKIFTLSKYYPISIMVYNDAMFNGVPWETIIKSYRNIHLKKKPFNTVREYCDDFISYLEKDKEFLFPINSQTSNFNARSDRIILKVISEVLYNLLRGCAFIG